MEKDVIVNHSRVPLNLEFFSRVNERRVLLLLLPPPPFLSTFKKDWRPSGSTEDVSFFSLFYRRFAECLSTARRFDIIGRSVRFFKARNLNESLSRALLLSTSNGHCCPTMGNRGSRGKGIFHRVKELYYWRTIRMRVKVGKFLKRNLFK